MAIKAMVESNKEDCTISVTQADTSKAVCVTM